MTIRRIVPDMQVPSEEQMAASQDFYGLLGFEEVMAAFSGGYPQTPGAG